MTVILSGELHTLFASVFSYNVIAIRCKRALKSCVGSVSTSTPFKVGSVPLEGITKTPTVRFILECPFKKDIPFNWVRVFCPPHTQTYNWGSFLRVFCETSLWDNIGCDASQKQRLWCSIAPLLFLTMFLSTDASIPSCRPTLRGAGISVSAPRNVSGSISRTIQ